MNHGGLGVYEEGSLSLPPELLEQAFIGRDGNMYGIHYVPQRSGGRKVDRKFDIMLTPIPYRFWPKTARLSVQIHHQPEMIHQISDFLKNEKVAIIQAESTRSGYRYEIWSFYLVFEVKDKLQFDSNRSVYAQTAARLEKLTKKMRTCCKKALFSDPRDIDLRNPLRPSFNTALAYFHNHVESLRRMRSGISWLYKPFHLTCRGAGLLESGSTGPDEPSLKEIVTGLELDNVVSLDPCVVFAGFDAQYLNIRVPLIPDEDLARFQEVIIEYERLGQADSCLGLIAYVTGRFKKNFNAWSFHSRTFHSKPHSEKGRLVFTLKVEGGKQKEPDAYRDQVAQALEPPHHIERSFGLQVSVRPVTVNRVRRKIHQSHQSRRIYDVFLSYRARDVTDANAVKQALVSEGLTCFMARDEVAAGDIFDDRILFGLKNSREMCVLFTPDSRKSEWVKTEWGAAWALNRPITPILLRTEYRHLPPRLKEHHAMRMSQISEYARTLKMRLDSAVLG